MSFDRNRLGAHERALALLARREHSRRELEQKLGGAGFDGKELNAALDRLETEDLLNDARYAESFVRSRRERGYGPLKIAYDLRRRGVSDHIVNNELSNLPEEWLEVARTQYQKRWATRENPDFREKARRARYLAGRGFPEEIVRRVLRDPV
ncbi:MAG: regulatory protein RecX [Pseudomonadota bacterium]|nr:regulatory protein RecX [Pseudomonadota bacterium]